jgi:hypothetical protein
MDRETAERIDRAPGRILVQVTQKHIDQCSDHIHGWTLTSNAISLALEEIGWTEASISMFNAFIGRTLVDLVCYKPETETSAQIQSARNSQPMTPFIACFNKERRER